VADTRATFLVGAAIVSHDEGSGEQGEPAMPNAPRRILTIALVLALAWALQPAAAADVKLTLWRLKTYIPPADKILDTNAQECAKKMGAEVQIQTYTFDDMWTKYTAAIESKTLPDVAELDSVGPARLANLGRLSDAAGERADEINARCRLSSQKVATRPGASGVGRQLIQICVFGASDAPNAFSVVRQVATCAQQAKDFAIAA
jgi:hypothetical protein